MALLTFLSINKKWLEIPPLDLYRIACLVSESKPEEKNETFKETEELIDEFKIDLL